MTKILNFTLAYLAFASVKAEHHYHATDMLMNILSQFLANPPRERVTTEREGILPKILNPLHWIPNFENIPWNPDSELTTVSRELIPINSLNFNFLQTEIAIRHGYSAESYSVITEDGYMLNIHRIPCGRAGCDGIRQPVFLQHGILASSADWVLSGPEKALGFMLADLGYDVWLGNARGNTYSRHHVSMSNSDKKYWDFSFHEMAIYDLPAEIDFIYNHRRSKIKRMAMCHQMTIF